MNHTDRELLLAEACEWSSPEEHRRVTTHLEECAECLDQFAGYCAERTILETAAPGVRGGGRTRILLTAAIVPFVLTMGLIFWKSTRPESPGTGGTAREFADPRGSIPTPVQGAKEQAFPFLGQLYPSREVSIFSKVQAYVERVEAARGARVKKGDLLAELKAPELQALSYEARVRLTQDEA